MWTALQPEIVSRLSVEGNNTVHSQLRTETSPGGDNAEMWKHCIDKLLEIRLLQNDWDGQDATAPSADLVDSAIILAVLLRQKGTSPPCRTVPGVTGSVVFEWQWADQTTLELEVIEPYFADVFLLTAGQPAKHWQVRGSNDAFMVASSREAVA